MHCVAKAALPEPHAAEPIIGGRPSYSQRGKAWDLIRWSADLIPCSIDLFALFDRFNALFDRPGNFP
jgi:hypothetical protein